jgi:hypothetical protein
MSQASKPLTKGLVMKLKEYSARILPVFIFAAFLCSASVTMAEGLIPNSSMEEGSGWPDKWPGSDKAGISWEEENGNHYIRMASPAPGELLMLYMEIKIPDGVNQLNLTWKQRVTNLVKGSSSWFDARIMMEWLSANSWQDGKKVAGKISTPTCGKDTAGWEDKSLTLDVPVGAKVLKFMPSLFRVQSGSFDLDDIQLTPVAPVAPVAQ